MNRVRTASRGRLLVFAWLAFCIPAHALETDQFYAWGKPIEDSTDHLNAWVRLTVQSALDSKIAEPPLNCEAVVNHVQKRLQLTIYQPIETWIISTELVDRVPRGLEETRDYRKQHLLAHTYPLDTARSLPPSPTVQVNEIRIGSDKLAHFFAEGWWYYKKWKKIRDKQSPDEVQRTLNAYGAFLEWWQHGMLLTGIVSLADMEANYQGFIFYHQLCHGDDPLLYQQDGRWQFSEKFDLRTYVSPEWDESWNPNIYNRLRWKGIRVAIASYCPMLHSPWVEQQRAYYREVDKQTPTENLVKALVAAGKLPDPQQFDITTVCSDQTGSE